MLYITHLKEIETVQMKYDYCKLITSMKEPFLCCADVSGHTELTQSWGSDRSCDRDRACHPPLKDLLVHVRHIYKYILFCSSEAL